VPKFSHECLSLPDPAQRVPAVERFKEYKPEQSPYRETYDPNDPNIEIFPTDRAAILAKLRETQRYLSEDETKVDSIPPSPVVGAIHHPERVELSPNMFARSKERASSLGSIPEGDDYREEMLASVPDTANKSKDTEVFEGVENGEQKRERKTSVSTVEVSPDSPPTTATAEEHIAPGTIEMPPTPFVEGENIDGPREITPEIGPSIVVSPATPGPSVKTSELVDPAKAAAIEKENGRTELKSRKSTESASTSTDTGKTTAVESGMTSRKLVAITALVLITVAYFSL